jgi:hypothetical protein
MDETTRTSGRHHVTRNGATRSMHACYIVMRETRRTLFANPAMPPRHAAPEWPAFDSDTSSAVA